MTAKRAKSPGTRRTPKPRRMESVHQFLVVLSDTDPVVWRRIQVPEGCTFWDLHVAMQDAMGWLDCHLHEFTLRDPRTGQLHALSIPDAEYPDDRPCLPSWEVPVTQYFSHAQPLALYVYDFGDDWRHVVMYEGTWAAEVGGSYPRCLGGARACPPENCGGTHGYARFLEAIANPDDPEHDELLAWTGGDYDPDAFSPTHVTFDDPRERWRRAFEE
jgi:hypothetical protein